MQKNANISWLPSGEPFSEQFHDFYFSTDGGLQETEYVFLQQNNFPQRFKTPEQQTIYIAETGFGTGLNFLVSSYHFLQTAHQASILDYTAIEKYPLSEQQLQRVFNTFKKNWPQLTPLSDELLTAYEKNFEQHTNTLQVSLFNGRVHLNLIIDDALSALKQCLLTQHRPLDAWYLDGFAPAKNPAMWQQELFDTMAQLSQAGTTLSTFTSAGIVRRGLLAAGFTISKVPGLGKKREILSGYLG